MRYTTDGLGDRLGQLVGIMLIMRVLEMNVGFCLPMPSRFHVEFAPFTFAVAVDLP